MAKIVELEKAGLYAEAAIEYEILEMSGKASKCRQLAIDEATKLEKSRQYEKAARVHEDLGMWEKACKVRMLEKTTPCYAKRCESR